MHTLNIYWNPSIYLWSNGVLRKSRESQVTWQRIHTVLAWRRPVITNTTREFLFTRFNTVWVYSRDALKLSTQ